MTPDFSRCREVSVPQEDGSIMQCPPPAHVKAGVEWIMARPFALLADEMGAMKSAQAIISAQFLFINNVIDKIIVVAPAAVRPTVWYSPELGEIATHLFEGLYSRVIDIHTDVKVWEWGAPNGRRLDWILTNYEFVRSVGRIDVIKEHCGPRTLLILDESSAVKNYKSQQTKACMSLRRACGRVLLLNGTPIADNPEDMFSQGNILSPIVLQCKFISTFRERYTEREPVMRAGGIPILTKWGGQVTRTAKWKNLEDLQQRFAPYVLRRMTRDCIDLPPILPPVTLTVTLTPATWRIYKAMRQDLVVWLTKNMVASSKTAAITVMRLSQITSGFLGGVENEDLYDQMLDEIPPPSFNAVQDIGREKLDFILEWQAERLLEDKNLKLLVWCKWIPELRRWLSEVKKFKHPVGCIAGQSLLGDGKDNEREYAERLLHPRTAPAGPVSVGGTFGTGSLGLNFTACHTVVNLSHGYEPWKRSQAEKRVDRPGQRQPVSVFDIVAQGPSGQRTIDHIVIRARRAKQNLNDWTAAAWRNELMIE